MPLGCSTVCAILREPAAAAELEIKVRWQGSGLDEIGIVDEVKNDAIKLHPGDIIVRIDPRYFRPTEVETLLGDASKARAKLGWTTKVSFQELVAEMVTEDLKAAERDALVKRYGYDVYDYHE